MFPAQNQRVSTVTPWSRTSCNEEARSSWGAYQIPMDSLSTEKKKSYSQEVYPQRRVWNLANLAYSWPNILIFFLIVSLSGEEVYISLQYKIQKCPGDLIQPVKHGQKWHVALADMTFNSLWFSMSLLLTPLKLKCPK